MKNKKYLIGKSTTGSLKFVRLSSYKNEDGTFVIQRSYGKVGGTETVSPTLLITAGKQKRTIEEQCNLQFNHLLKQYLDKGYVEADEHNLPANTEHLEIRDQNGSIKPMLAKPYNKVTDKSIFDNEWLISPKIDGVRGIMYFKDNAIHIASRGGKEYTDSTKYIREDKCLLGIFQKYPDLILDGELYIPNTLLQVISGIVRKNEPNSQLLFYCYDAIFNGNLEEKAAERISKLHNLGSKKDIRDSKLYILQQDYISGLDNMLKAAEDYVSKGYEGAVIRRCDTPYLPNGRTDAMVKIKTYQDAEFEIIGIQEGLRPEDYCFRLKYNETETFAAKPIGTVEQRMSMKRNIGNLIGKMATVKFFYTSAQGVPLQPHFICVRDYD